MKQIKPQSFTQWNQTVAQHNMHFTACDFFLLCFVRSLYVCSAIGIESQRSPFVANANALLSMCKNDAYRCTALAAAARHIWLHSMRNNTMQTNGTMAGCAYRRTASNITVSWNAMDLQLHTRIYHQVILAVVTSPIINGVCRRTRRTLRFASSRSILPTLAVALCVECNFLHDSLFCSDP